LQRSLPHRPGSFDCVEALVSPFSPARPAGARTQVQAAGPKRCALTEKLPIVCLEALTCLSFVHAVHATDSCGSPLSAFQ